MTTMATTAAGARQTSPPAAAIEIQNLVVSYGSKRAVDGLNLQVPLGAVFGFLGPNGAGKTTTIKALLGFRPANGGSARVLGYDIGRKASTCAPMSATSARSTACTTT